MQSFEGFRIFHHVSLFPGSLYRAGSIKKSNNSLPLYFPSHVSHSCLRTCSDQGHFPVHTLEKLPSLAARFFIYYISADSNGTSLLLVTDTENLTEAFITKKRFIRCLANERIRGAWYSCNNIEINRDTDATRWRCQQCHSHRATLCRSSVCTFASTSPLYVSAAKRNIRNECAILIRRVKGMLREECGYASCLTLRH